MSVQVSVTVILAVGVMQGIIMGGIDLPSGSVVGATAVIVASLAQRADYTHTIYPGRTGLSPVIPLAAGLSVWLLAGMINGSLIVFTNILPYTATPGMMV